MKKLFIAALLAVTVSASAFANANTTLAAGSFKSEFRNASNVTWVTTADYTKASFTMDNQRMEAFYNADGEKIGTSKSVNLEELPLAAKRQFAKKYDGYTVKEAIRFTGTEESAYYISAQGEKGSVILKIEDNSNMTVLKSSKN